MKSNEEMTRNVIERGERCIRRNKRQKAVLAMALPVFSICCISLVTALSLYRETVDSGDDTDYISESTAEDIDINENAFSETESKESGDSEVPANITKDQLYYRCMNSMEYLGHISGDISVCFSKSDPTIFRGTVNHDFTNWKYYSYLENIDSNDHDNCLQIVTTYNDSTVCHSLFDNIYDGTKKHQILRDSLCPTLAATTFAYACPENPADADSENAVTSIEQLTEEQINATYGGDPTGEHTFGAFYIPQEMTIGYLKNFDNWDIADVREVQGRSCAVVHGTADPEYGSCFGVETFEIFVDQATGVWMQFEGYDAEGNVQQYVYSENVCFGDDAKPVPLYKDEYAEGFDSIDMNELNKARINETINNSDNQ